MVEPHSSNFRVITTNVLSVQIFRKFTVKTTILYRLLYRNYFSNLLMSLLLWLYDIFIEEHVIEPCHKIMVLFVLRKLIHQMRMHSYLVGLYAWFLVGSFVYFHTSGVRTAKALVKKWGGQIFKTSGSYDFGGWGRWMGSGVCSNATLSPSDFIAVDNLKTKMGKVLIFIAIVHFCPPHGRRTKTATNE